MSRGARAGIAGALFAVVVGLVVFTAMAFVGTSPPTIDYTQGHVAGRPLNLTVETVGSIGFGPHPEWVSYLAKDPQGKWINSTIWQIPAHTRINVTIYQFDSGSPLRNQQRGLVTGTEGGTISLNGKLVRVINSYAGYGVGHTFSVPALGINVPLEGVNSSAKTFCSSAPCLPSEHVHNTVKFSFESPGIGQYRWQCFIPCGLSYLFGNGGPMSTIGFMGGFLKVVA